MFSSIPRFLAIDSHSFIQLAKYGGLASGVPGEIRGFAAAHAKYGKLPWARLFQPSIGLFFLSICLSPFFFSLTFIK